MWPRLCYRVFVVCLLVGMYVMVWCLVSVTRLDARTVSPGLSHVPVDQDLVAGDIRQVPRNLHGLITKTNSWPRRFKPKAKIDWCIPLSLRTNPGSITALASFPGSGNTWLRYLLQQATGISTGSVYKDYALLKNGFPAENVSNGSVITVKTHEWGPETMQLFDSTILLVRDPFSSLRAEFNRRSGGHIGHASPDKYKRNNGRHWREFVLSKGRQWEDMILDWFRNFKGPILVMFYKDLCEDVETELKRVLDFLNISVSPQAMECALSRKQGIYKRSKKLLSFDIFDPELTDFLEAKKAHVYNILQTERRENEYNKPS